MIEEVLAALALGLGALVVIVAVLGIDNWFALRRLRERIERLERGSPGVPPVAASPATAAPTTTPTAPPPPAVAPSAPPVPAPATKRPARRPFNASRLEEYIGGIWLQNVGSILLLLGTFFLILWGYSNGRLGPEVLVGAGVVLGGALAWRGDRLARSIRSLGHALLGVGLGIIYITIHVGHFRMHVLSEWPAFALLALLSIISTDIGLSRRQAIIATLGVLGAFLPLMLGPLSGAGFHLAHRDRLIYLVLVNAVVFILATVRGYRGLVLVALIGTSIAWMVDAASGSPWGLTTQIGLAAMYSALGIALVARLVRTAGAVRNLDIASVILAPVLLLVVSVPFFESSHRAVAGSLLVGLGVLHLAAAFWVDARRSERDLWRPLIAVGTLFLTGALERYLDPAHLTLAWSVEGALLIWMGLAPRGEWFRLLGYAVTALVPLRLIWFPQSYAPEAGDALGFLAGVAMRDLVAIGVLFVVSERIRRRSAFLTERERLAPNLWLSIAHFSLMLWTLRESPHVAHALRSSNAAAAIVAFAWAAQAGALLSWSLSRSALVPRAIAYGIAGAAFLAFLWGSAASPPWRPGDRPLLYPGGFFLLLAALSFVAMTLRLRSCRDRLLPREEHFPNAAALVASLAFLIWSAREAGRAAHALMPGDALDASRVAATATLTAVITSGAWIVQAGILLVIGWTRRSAFFRWVGLGLVGLTTLKFVFLDLERVEVFWRFVTALGVGAVMLLVSFVYQRRRRSEEEPNG